MKKSKIAALILAAMMTGSALAGCGGAAAPADASNKDSSSAAASGEKEVLEVAVFEGGFGGEYWEEMMAAYQKEHPNVEFKSVISPKVGEIIRPRVVSGDTPDILVMTDGDQSGLLSAMIKDKALLEITDVFEGPAYDSDVPLKDVIIDGHMDSRNFRPYGDGKIYLAPRETGYSTLVYNKHLFEEKGWSVPKTWDEFFALGDVAKAEGRALFTYQGLYPGYLGNMLTACCADVLGRDGMEKMYNYEEGSFNNPQVIEILTNIQRLARDYMMEGTIALNHTQSQTEMMQGHALFIPNGSWMVNEMKDAPREEGFTFGITPWPTMTEDSDRFIASSYGQVSIPKNAKNPERAKDFLRFLYTDESARLMAEKCSAVLCTKNALEVSKEFLSEDSYNMFKIDEDVQPIFADWGALPVGSKIDLEQTLYNNALTKLMSLQITPEECAEIVEDAFAQIREEKAKLEG